MLHVCTRAPQDVLCDDGVFCNGVEGSARPSDAIALALRVDAPIRGADEVLEEAGIDLPDFLGRVTQREGGASASAGSAAKPAVPPKKDAASA